MFDNSKICDYTGNVCSTRDKTCEDITEGQKIQIKDVYIPAHNVKNNIKHANFMIKMLLPKMKLSAKILSYIIIMVN